MTFSKIKTAESDRQLVSVFMDEEYPPELDFNWLMPVVEKIGDIPFGKDLGWSENDYIERNAYPYPRTFGMKDKEGNYMVRLNANQLFSAPTLIEATWLAVVDFIEFHNQKLNS